MSEGSFGEVGCDKKVVDIGVILIDWAYVC